MISNNGEFDLVVTKKHCDIVVNETGMLLPLTMTLEECIECCCEKKEIEFIEIVEIYDEDGRDCQGKFSYEY